MLRISTVGRKCNKNEGGEGGVAEFVRGSKLFNIYWQVVRSAPRGEFRPRQTRQLPRAVDLKERLLSCQSY